MPKHHDKHHRHDKHHKHDKHRRSAVDTFIDEARLDARLAAFIPDRDDRAFLLRCVLDEGPTHHRGANYVLLSLLTELARRLGVTSPSTGDTRPFPMRLPPHLEEEIDDDEWPVGVPEAPLDELADGDERAVDAMVDCLTDGPPQHAVANVLMLQLLDALLRKADRAR